MKRPLPLRFVLFLLMAILSCALILLVAVPIGETSVVNLKRQVGSELAHHAFQVQEKLDRSLFERLRHVTNTAHYFGQITATGDTGQLRAWLEDVKSGYTDYAWLGFVNRQGRVVIGTGHRLEGADVPSAPWFQAGLVRPFVSNVRVPNPPANLVSAPESARSRIVDLAAPVKTPDGLTIGVVAAFLKWDWAHEISDLIVDATDKDAQTEVVVLNRNGGVLLGPPPLQNHTLKLKGIERNRAEAPASFVEVWPDGKTYLTGISARTSYHRYASLGWVVLVRQPIDVAYAAVTDLHRTIAFWVVVAILLALLAAHALSQQIAAPLIALADAAERTRKGGRKPLPLSSAYTEVATLSRSLRSLVGDLKESEQNLLETNASLDQTVRIRTCELEERNVALEAARDAAQRATLSKTRFLTAASHDLRQPVQAVTLLLRALARRAVDNQSRDLVAKAELGLQSLRTMVDTLLDQSRLEMGSVRPEREAVAIDALIEEIATSCSVEAEQRNLDFRWHTLPCVITADYCILQTVIRNIVSNAFKFTRSGGVLLAARRLGGGLVIDVYDTGIGISADRLQSIFDAYERSDEHVHGPNEGLGLGLDIVRRYVSLMGMDVSINSVLGSGTRVRITVPASLVAEPTELGLANTRADGVDISGAIILVIDDDTEVLHAMAVDLSDRGCIVRTANDIVQATRWCGAGFRPDVVIADASLGNGRADGLILASTLCRTIKPTAALIAMSGEPDAAGWLPDLGPRPSILRKPISSVELAARIAEVREAAAANSTFPSTAHTTASAEADDIVQYAASTAQ